MLVTHDMGVIAETADRVAVMYAGRVAEIGLVADVIHKAAAPVHRRTDGLDSRVRQRPRAVNPDRRRHAAARRHPHRLRLQPRCTKVFDKCKTTRPDLMPASSSMAACWLHEGKV